MKSKIDIKSTEFPMGIIPTAQSPVGINKDEVTIDPYDTVPWKIHIIPQVTDE